MCLGFNRVDLITEAITQFNYQQGIYPVERKVLFDPSYPAQNMPQEAHADALKWVANEYGWEYIKIKNINVSENWKQAIQIMGLKEGDVLYGCDPDERPKSPRYLDAIMDIFNWSPEAYYVGMCEPGVAESCNHFVRHFGSTYALDFHSLVAWPVGAFDVGWMKKIDGPKMLANQYGYIEHGTSNAAMRFGGKFYMLRDFISIHLKDSDAKYTQWKLESAHRATSIPFEEWLKKQG